MGNPKSQCLLYKKHSKNVLLLLLFLNSVLRDPEGEKKDTRSQDSRR